MRAVLCAVVALGVATPGAAAQAAPGLRWDPPVPVGGSLVTVVVTPASVGASAAARGTLGDEPLHLELASDGTFRAIGAVPLGGADSLPIDIVVLDADGAVAWASAWVPVAPRRVPVERIRTGRRFAQPPDSATRVRIRMDHERVYAVFEASHTRPRLWHTRFVRPRAGAIRSAFGTRRVVNGKPGGRHWGVDVSGARGAPVRAANRGVVALIADTYYGGCAVYVDHGAGLVTGYLHLSAILVAPGDTVEARQLLGRVGASGRVTGPHLHWLAHYGGIAIDPFALTHLEARPLPAGGGETPLGLGVVDGAPSLEAEPAVPSACRR